jgi:hypothetical protein
VARLAAPLLTELALSGPALLGHAPARLPDVHAAAPVLIGLRLRPEGGAVRITGRLAGKPWEEQLRVAAVAPGAGNAAVPVLYAREAVEDLEMRRAAGETGAIDEQIERLGMQLQIATRLTSWVAVSEEPTVDPGQPTRRERIPQALSEGLSIEGLGLHGQTVRLAQRSAMPSVASMQTFLSLAQLRLVAEEAVPPVELSGRIVLRRGRELVIEVDLDRPLNWHPSRARVAWDDGTEIRAIVDKAGTTRAGTLDAGQVIRLVLRLAKDGLAAPPARVLLNSGDTSIVVRLAP